MKAVLWTDVFQVVMMISGISVALIFGSIQTGGFRKAWQIAADSGRVTFNELVLNFIYVALFNSRITSLTCYIQCKYFYYTCFLHFNLNLLILCAIGIHY